MMTTNKPDNDSRLLQELNQQLDDSVDSLDARTLSKLNQARQRAIESRSHSRTNWIVSGVFASLLVAVSVGVLVNTYSPLQQNNHNMANYDDLELICRDGSNVERFASNANFVAKKDINSIGTDFSSPEDWHHE